MRRAAGNHMTRCQSSSREPVQATWFQLPTAGSASSSSSNDLSRNSLASSSHTLPVVSVYDSTSGGAGVLNWANNVRLTFAQDEPGNSSTAVLETPRLLG
ncbi:hypothetical protein FOMPIDRAFT_88825 [Fomitopsis schrenkii]|uniref:Uncharacterized protein n=1 Tax=Fomitopsis schrenkii TaxID=2126942 RepID=S8FLD8_FOMSC|nr:hypothetical protein FOMPIDRAFT_88825 [Fomitopsis schrenkii]